MSEENKKGVAILGSTGSIGTQALEVIQAHPDKFQVEVLTAHNNVDLLIAQAKEFSPNVVVIGNEALYDKVQSALDPLDIKVYCGAKSLQSVVENETIDIVLTAMVGFAGLLPTLNAINQGKNIALANKETLVVAGEIVTKEAQKKGVNIYPVDSEHSAIFQCLVGEFHNKIEKIILTASGGPFRGMNLEQLAQVTKAQALKHPNWDMGAKITVDSASMMNKGLEVIEAKWLFALNPSQIDVVVHPQSIIHSMVQFEDGSMKAQLGHPDMKLPIQYALSYPNRIKLDTPRLDIAEFGKLTFEKPDLETFHCLKLAYYAMEKGGNAPCILNAANEVAVDLFLKEKIKFIQIPELIESCLKKVSFVKSPMLEDYLETDRETRRIGMELMACV